MTEEAVRDRAQAFCRALISGDIGQAADHVSRELRANLGPVVAMLPLPLTEGTIASVETTGSGYRVVLSLVGEGETVQLETRWKERDGQPTVVEASRVHDEPVPEEPTEEGAAPPPEERTQEQA
jgi:hypothetical protein